MTRILTIFCSVAASVTLMFAQAPPRRTLDMYVVDVEGGNATLFVAPSGESLLFDTGNGGAGAVRDAERIRAAATDAGLSRIDHLVTTHYHGDHFGGLAELAARIPIRNFIDHGPNVQPNDATDKFMQGGYRELYTKGSHTVAKPGDRIALGGAEVRILTAAGQAITAPLPGAGRPNPYCAGFKPHTVNPVSGQPVGGTEDEQSVGAVVSLGKFRALYLGDFTWNKEFELMCPNNPIGMVDVFLASRHGQSSSNSEALVHAVQPRVILVNNSARKGGQPDAMKVLLSAPRLEDLWQIHFSFLGGQEYSVPGVFIANTEDPAVPVAPSGPPQPGAPPAPQHTGTAHWLKVSAQNDGSFTVTNGRNAFSKTYRVISGTN